MFFVKLLIALRITEIIDEVHSIITGISNLGILSKISIKYVNEYWVENIPYLNPRNSASLG